jgi:glutamate-ammonia-ligase adenylyltransferase
MAELAQRHDDPAAAVAAVRGVRRQELLRIAFGDLLGMLDVVTVCEALSAVAEATLEVALRVAVDRTMGAVAAGPGCDELPIRFAVIAMGRLGGAETSYGSDADVMFVFDEPGARGSEAASHDGTRLAQQVAETLRALLAAPSSSDPPLGIDADLRPEGRNGALVRSLRSYETYYARWSSAWEAQALLRARFVAGDAELGARFTAMIDEVRYPSGGLSAADQTEIRRLKARVDTERLPRGADPTTHTKLGRGGLTDIEWTVQFLQLAHGRALPALRTPRTLDALAAAAKESLVGEQQAAALGAAWRMATRVRNALMLVHDRPEDQLPHQGPLLVAVGRAMGYPAGFDPGQLVDDYRRAARRARRVVEDVFYAG